MFEITVYRNAKGCIDPKILLTLTIMSLNLLDSETNVRCSQGLLLVPPNNYYQLFLIDIGKWIIKVEGCQVCWESSASKNYIQGFKIICLFIFTYSFNHAFGHFFYIAHTLERDSRVSALLYVHNRCTLLITLFN